jgi:FKBP-type peptidyl-prolyl cis-trans isomerase
MNDKLVIQDEVVGTGTEAVSGKSVTVNYVGTLIDGTKFDSSYDRNQPFTFNLGTGEVISGWDQGVVGMKVGGKRKLTIPSSLGYGSQDQGAIPANSTLIFEIELLKVE